MKNRWQDPELFLKLWAHWFAEFYHQLSTLKMQKQSIGLIQLRDTETAENGMILKTSCWQADKK